MTPKFHDKRITVRLSDKDERALQTLAAIMRPHFTFLNLSDVVRRALHEAEKALSAEAARLRGAMRCMSRYLTSIQLL